MKKFDLMDRKANRPTITKAMIDKRIAFELKFHRNKVGEITKLFLNMMVETMVEGGIVVLPAFGDIYLQAMRVNYKYTVPYHPGKTFNVRRRVKVSVKKSSVLSQKIIDRYKAGVEKKEG